MSENKRENKRVTLSFLQKVLASIVTLINSKASKEELDDKQPIGDYALKEDLNVYVQDDEPVDVPDGTVWVDTDAEGSYGVIQADWNEIDETHPAFIKNKPTSFELNLDAEDAVELVAELGLIDPIISEDGEIYTDIDGKIFSL